MHRAFCFPAAITPHQPGSGAEPQGWVGGHAAQPRQGSAGGSPPAGAWGSAPQSRAPRTSSAALPSRAVPARGACRAPCAAQPTLLSTRAQRQRKTPISIARMGVQRVEDPLAGSRGRAPGRIQGQSPWPPEASHHPEQVSRSSWDPARRTSRRRRFRCGRCHRRSRGRRGLRAPGCGHSWCCWCRR